MLWDLGTGQVLLWNYKEMALLAVQKELMSFHFWEKTAGVLCGGGGGDDDGKSIELMQ